MRAWLVSLIAAVVAVIVAVLAQVGGIHARAEPDPVTGISTTVTLMGDAAPDPGVTYHWSVITTPAGGQAVIVDPASKTTVVTFTAAGRYRVACERTDADGKKSKTYKTTVEVDGVLSGLAVSPGVASLPSGASLAFTAQGSDQFGASLSTFGQVAWSATEGGTITADGLVTAGPIPGLVMVTAHVGGLEATATVTIPGGNQPPTIAVPATADPAAVLGTTAALSVRGADDGGEAALTCTWESQGPAPVEFSLNGTAPARSTVVTFAQGGTYVLTATLTDAAGASASSAVTVVVWPTVTTLAVVPATALTPRRGAVVCTIQAVDQFGFELVSPPTIWSHTGVGSLDATGRFTATDDLGTAIILATAGGQQATATLTVVNTGPTVAIPPTASPDPLQGTVTALSVLGADDADAAGLTYAWTATGPAAVSFSPNGTNAAQASTATVSVAGSYALTVTITDGEGAAISASVPLTVQATATSVAVSPATASVPRAGNQVYTASVTDQFGAALVGAQMTWNVDTRGTIEATGAFTAGADLGTATVTGTTGTVSGQATVMVVNTPPTVVTPITLAGAVSVAVPVGISVLGDDDSGETALTYAWSATGPGTMAVGASGTNPARSTDATFSTVGSYTVTVTITDPDGGSVSDVGTVTVGPAPQPPEITGGPTVLLDASGLTATCNVQAIDDGGEPALTYAWSATGPATVAFSASGTNAAKASIATVTLAGTYTVTATVTDGLELSVQANVDVTVPDLAAPVVGGVTPLVTPAAFDVARWASDAAYRAEYLGVMDPGRIWQTADPGTTVPILHPDGGRRIAVPATEEAEVVVVATPGAPVTALCYGQADFVATQLNTVTLTAGADGKTTFRLRTTVGPNRCRVVIGSPLCAGTVAYDVIFE